MESESLKSYQFSSLPCDTRTAMTQLEQSISSIFAPYWMIENPVHLTREGLVVITGRSL